MTNIKNKQSLPTGNQKGLISVWVLALLIAGITAGTILVQNGVNFIPKAQEQTESLGEVGDPEKCNTQEGSNGYCVGTTRIREYWSWRNDECRWIISSETNSCTDESKPEEPAPENPAQPEVPKPEDQPAPNNPKDSDQESLNPIDSAKMQACGNNNDCKNALCLADEVTYCDNREGKPRAMRKTGGYYDPSHSLKDANGCVFDFFEVASKNSECGKSDSKSGDVVYMTEEDAEKVDSDREKNRPAGSGGSSSGSGTSASAACTVVGTEQSFKDEKVTGNLVRFYAILAGQPEFCVPADLGVEPKQEAESADGKKGRLMLCSGSETSGPDLSWKVIVDNKLVKSSKTPAPDKSTIEDGFKANISAAKAATKI